MPLHSIFSRPCLREPQRWRVSSLFFQSPSSKLLLLIRARAMVGAAFRFPEPVSVLGRPGAPESYFLAPSLPCQPNSDLYLRGELGWERLLAPLSGIADLVSVQGLGPPCPRWVWVCFYPSLTPLSESYDRRIPATPPAVFQSKAYSGGEASCPSCRGGWLFPSPRGSSFFLVMGTGGFPVV